MKFRHQLNPICYLKNLLNASTLIIAATMFVNFGIAEAAAEYTPDIAMVSEGLWRDVSERAPGALATGKRMIVPDRYRTVGLDHNALGRLISITPHEDSVAVKDSDVIMALPLPDGGSGLFQIVESPVMAPELMAKFPGIRTFAGQGIDDPTATVRFDWTPHGFHAMILSPSGRIFIDPYSSGDTSLYISYFTRDHITNKAERFFELPVIDLRGDVRALSRSMAIEVLQRSSGSQLRTYRLAVAATGEYTAYHGGTVSLGLAAIVTAVNRITGIYEAEVAVRLQLVANNNLIVYTNSTTDPYTNNDGSTMLDENQTTLDSVIGSANYDIGHVFSTGGGGVAYLEATCWTGYKAGGVTGSSAPTGDAFWVDYVAHEMGHQFGANHTFNSKVGSCGGGNREPSTAYEPGSGSTIMGYAGICGADDLQLHSDAYFHTISFDEIRTYVEDTRPDYGGSCGTPSSTGNTPPVPNAGTGGFTIPANTPFTLTGSATDANGDTITYNWEEFDLGVGSGGPPDDPLKPPFFRSWTATTSPSRTFPRLSDLLNNTTAIGEVLPDTSMTLNFRLTARDNRSGGGGVNYASLSFNVTTAAGPFQVTSPNTAVTWAGTSSQTVIWNVANTGSGTTVNCANVGILLSTDGGNTFSTVLSASTPNDGSQTITVPNVGTTTARVKVYCLSNPTHYFFDISDTNFTITFTPYVTIATSPSGREITVDGSSYTAPKTFYWTPGSSHDIGVASPQSGTAGTRYVYSSWSDGGSQSHSITAPVSSATYTANFTTQYLLTTSVAPVASGTVTPDCSSGCWYNSGSSPSLSPTPTGGNTFSLWSDGISSYNAPLTFTISGPTDVTANFNSVAVTGPVRIAGPAPDYSPAYYSSIAAAYAAAENNDVIQTKVMTYNEAISFDRTDVPNLTVTLKGGYNDTFSDNTGKTTVDASGGVPFTIQSGTIIPDNFTLK